MEHTLGNGLFIHPLGASLLPHNYVSLIDRQSHNLTVSISILHSFIEFILFSISLEIIFRIWHKGLDTTSMSQATKGDVPSNEVVCPKQRHIMSPATMQSTGMVQNPTLGATDIVRGIRGELHMSHP